MLQEKPSQLFDRILKGLRRFPDDSDQPIVGITVQPFERTNQNSVFSREVVRASIAQKTSESILQARTLMGQLIRGDDESKRLLLEYFREGIEEKYLNASIATDQTRLSNLKKQVVMVNEGLNSLTGKETTIVEMYKGLSNKNPDEYQPIFDPEGNFNPRGFFDLLKFHKELAIKILSASEIASESAELEAQTQLIPLREEVNRLAIREDKKTAIELSDAKEELVKAEMAKGEIRTSFIRGWTTPLIITIAEAPIVFLQAPVERLELWMEKANDKAVPISAVSGAIAGPIILFTKIASESSIIESWLSRNIPLGVGAGIIGGSLTLVSAWLTAKNLLPALKGGFDYVFDRLNDFDKKRKERSVKWRV